MTDGLVTLAEWRKARGISQRAMASRISAALGRPVHGPNVCQWENGVMPGADVAEAIRRATRGAVKPASFRRPTGNPAGTPCP